MSVVSFKPIAHIETDFHDKFGVPRQSGIVEQSVGKIVFEKEFSSPTAFKGLEGFSHLWILWHFSLFEKSDEWSPTVRPPKLGGNKRVGVFASRSPNRPNPIGLSCVKILSIEHNTSLGTVIYVSGADMVNGTPIFDIKPYVPYADSYPNASTGFSVSGEENTVQVLYDENAFSGIDETLKDTIISLLSLDPRPSYRGGGNRLYKMDYADCKITFKYDNGKIYITEIRSLH